MINQSKLGYKHTPLGWIPELWEIKEFSDVTSKILDGTHFSPKSKNGDFKYITSKNIRNDGLDLSEVGYIDENEHKEIYNRCPVIYGDILLTKDGAGTGTCCKNTLHEQFSLLSSVSVLRANENVCENEFLYQFIKSPRGQFVIKNAIAGQAITRITLEKIRRFDIILPTLTEQRKIAAILNTWDEVIAKTQQLVIQLHQRNKGLMQQLLQFKYNDVYLPLCELLIEKSFVVKEMAKEFEVLSVTKNGLISQKEYFKKEVASDDRSKYKIVEKGDIVMSGLNFWMGSIDMVSENQTGIVSPAYKVFKVNAKFVSPRFFKHFVRSAQMLKILISCSIIGASIVRRNFDREMFDNWLLKLPSLKEQERIADVLDNAKSALILSEQKLAVLQHQKKGLMQKLLMGEIRVNI